MYAIFFTTQGLAIQILIHKGKSMNARFYKKKPKKACKTLPKTSIEDGYLLYCSSHDNALSNQAGSMTSFLKEQGDYFLEHPPYPPDIAPVTFFMLVENILSAKR